MAGVKTFQDLLVWQKAHQLTLSIYGITSNFLKTELFGLVSQMRRAAVSVPANIVEGFRRKTVRDSLNFYNIAHASLEELKYRLLLSKDLEYLTENTYKTVLSTSEETGRLLTRWIQSQKKYL